MRAFFLSLIDANNKKASSARFLSVTTVLTILYVWTWVSLYTREIQDIPVGVTTFAGVVVLGKMGQSFAEVRKR